jgi:Flp pilus assembly protein protease CpaA
MLLITIPHEQLILHVIAFALALTGGLIDFRTNKIPNKLTFPGMLAGLIISTILHGFLMTGALGSLAGITIAFAVLMILRVGVEGPGDVKLMMAVGAFLGWLETILVIFYFLITWGVVALVRIGSVMPWKNLVGAIFAKHAGGQFFTPEDVERVNQMRKSKFPIGFAIACGVVLAGVLHTQTLQFVGFAN